MVIQARDATIDIQVDNIEMQIKKKKLQKL